jgi:hypothetical protein
MPVSDPNDTVKRLSTWNEGLGYDDINSTMVRLVVINQMCSEDQFYGLKVDFPNTNGF